MDFLNVQNVPDDHWHPAVEFLRDLEATAYYHDRNLLGEKIHLVNHTFRAILKWADLLKCHLKVGTPYVLWFHFSDRLLPRMWLSLFPMLI